MLRPELGLPAAGQVGKGLLDSNSAPEKELAALPHMTPATVKGRLDQRPFASIVDANAYLTSQSLTAVQVTEIDRKAFAHVNLNTASAEEVMLIPGAGKRMVRSSPSTGSGRRGHSSTRKSASTSGSIGAKEVAGLRRYVVIQ